jgi:hypothetical protein
MRKAAVSLLLSAALLVIGPRACPASGPCAGASTLWAEGYSASVGDTIGVYATIQDCSGNPLADQLVYFFFSRDSITVIGNPGLTDRHGFVQASMTAEVIRAAEIYAACPVASGGEIIIGPALEPVQWVAGGETPVIAPRAPNPADSTGPSSDPGAITPRKRATHTVLPPAPVPPADHGI